MPAPARTRQVGGNHVWVWRAVACYVGGFAERAAGALDIVVETIILSGNDPTFDAGRGSVLSQEAPRSRNHFPGSRFRLC